MLKDKVAVITGASRGIGEAIARHMAACGAKVVLAARKIDMLETVAASISASNGTAMAHACHTGQPDQIRALLRRACREFGQVDVAVNNAATNPHFGPMLSVEDRAWNKTFEVNLRGYFEVARQVADHLLARQAPGAIINISSVVGQMGAPSQGIYAMTKAAVESMTRTLAVELGPAGIRVNAIAPGLIETRFSQAIVTNEQLNAQVRERTALKRLGLPDDVAGVATFLASEHAAYITGVTLPVDGGWSIT